MTCGELRDKYPGYFLAKLDVPPVDGGFPKEFWIITAYEPNGRTPEGVTNEQLDATFEARLTASGWRYFRAAGYDADSDHREEGFGIVCSESEAVEMMLDLEQNAIFHVKDGEVSLLFREAPGLTCHAGSWGEKTTA